MTTTTYDIVGEGGRQDIVECYIKIFVLKTCDLIDSNGPEGNGVLEATDQIRAIDIMWPTAAAVGNSSSSSSCVLVVQKSRHRRRRAVAQIVSMDLLCPHMHSPPLMVWTKGEIAR